MNDSSYTTPIARLTAGDIAVAGGKAANLGELRRAGFPVPDGFVVLAQAYRSFVETNHLQARIDGITRGLRADDMSALEEASRSIGRLFEESDIAVPLASELVTGYEQLQGKTVAVRSSATAEDLPGASFAGQYTTFLNVTGSRNVLEAVRKCWASLWNGRAMSYRLRKGLGDRSLAVAVVVQELVGGDKSGILFTANPVNGRRDQLSISASWGLGEAIVSGEVTPDEWTLAKPTGDVISSTINNKEVMTVRTPSGTENTPVSPELRREPTLTGDELRRLADLGVRIEEHYGYPKDIEWTFREGQLYLLQARPITSLYPMPQPAPGPEDGLRVYFNLNLVAQQIVEPFTPMGLDLFRLMYGYGFARLVTGKPVEGTLYWFKVSGGRGWLDVTDLLRSERWRGLVDGLGEKDAVTSEALREVLDRYGERIEAEGDSPRLPLHLLTLVPDVTRLALLGMFSPEKAAERAAQLGDEEVQRMERAAAELRGGIEEHLGFVEEQAYRVSVLTVRQMALLGGAGQAFDTAPELVERWLGDTALIDPVYQSLTTDPTSQMTLALWRAARRLRAEGVEPRADHPVVVEFLCKYGHRGLREIDLGMPRWSERPGYVLDVLRSYMDQLDTVDREAEFEQGVREAEQAIERVTAAVRRKKGAVAAWRIRRSLVALRAATGMRERPKFDLTHAIAVLRPVLREVGRRLVTQGRLDEPDDVFYVTFGDIRAGGALQEVVASNRAEYEAELQREAAPRVMLSTGEAIYNVRSHPDANSLVGTAVSPGTYEGVARVVMNPEGAELQPGEILVARSTDPSWTPLFLHAGALVMEIGGVMAHGAVVAREYGLPAVAAVDGATQYIRTGQRIRVDGQSGQVTIVS